MDAMTMSEDRNRQMVAQRFGLYLGLATIIMLFVALTSAYLVRQGAGNWLFVKMPIQFWISTGIIIASSMTMYLSKKAYKELQIGRSRILIWSTFILGCLFVASQYQGWLALGQGGVYLDGNPGGSFIYAITWVHVVHVALGLLLMLIVGLKTTLNNFNSDRAHNLGLISTYWHFVGGLWIYLFIFFQIKFF
jgi:cytochrome c oxidase subunit 3